MTDAPDISLVIPLFREEENVDPLVEEIGQALRDLDRSWELVLVDDGSDDGTWTRIRDRAARDPRVRGLRFAANRGQTAAFAAGFRAARGALIVTMDADLQNDPADIPAMVAALERDSADVVLGIRRDRHDNFVRRASSKIANAYRRWRTQDDSVDTGCPLKVFRSEFLDDMPLFTGMHRFFPTLARLRGASKIVQVEVNHRPRLHGESKYGVWNRLWVGLADVRAVRWMQKRNLDYRVAEQVGGDVAETTPAPEPCPSSSRTG